MPFPKAYEFVIIRDNFKKYFDLFGLYFILIFEEIVT